MEKIISHEHRGKEVSVREDLIGNPCLGVPCVSHR